MEERGTDILHADVQLAKAVRCRNILAQLMERLLTVVHIDKRKSFELTTINHQIKQLRNLHAVYLAVNYLQLL